MDGFGLGEFYCCVTKPRKTSASVKGNISKVPTLPQLLEIS